MSTEESLLPKPPELRIVLVGKVGAGKTSVMNTLLMSSEDNEKPASERPPRTEQCQMEKAMIGGQKVVIVDTPGLCNADKTDKEVMKEIRKGMLLAFPGPHVFLFVLSCSERFTKEEQGMVEFFIKEIFGVNDGERVARYTMVLFTSGDELKDNGKTIHEFIVENSDLINFVKKCKDDFHVIDNRDRGPSQVSELLEKINSKVKNDEVNYYQRKIPEKDEKDVSTAADERINKLSINGCALAGAGIGAAVSNVVGSPIGVVAGTAAGAVVGGVLGCVGVVVAGHIKAYIRRRQEVRKSSANV